MLTLLLLLSSNQQWRRCRRQRPRGKGRRRFDRGHHQGQAHNGRLESHGSNYIVGAALTVFYGNNGEVLRCFGCCSCWSRCFVQRTEWKRRCETMRSMKGKKKKEKICCCPKVCRVVCKKRLSSTWLGRSTVVCDEQHVKKEQGGRRSSFDVFFAEEAPSARRSKGSKLQEKVDSFELMRSLGSFMNGWITSNGSLATLTLGRRRRKYCRNAYPLTYGLFPEIHYTAF